MISIDTYFLGEYMISRYIYFFSLLAHFCAQADFIAENKTDKKIQLRLWYRTKKFTRVSNAKYYDLDPQQVEKIEMEASISGGQIAIYLQNKERASFNMSYEYYRLLQQAKTYMPTVTITLNENGDFVINIPKNVEDLTKEINQIKSEVKKESKKSLTKEEDEELIREFSQEEATAPLGAGGKVKCPAPVRSIVGEYLVGEE